VCGNQPVVSTISSRLAPSGRCIRRMILADLVALFRCCGQYCGRRNRISVFGESLRAGHHGGPSGSGRRTSSITAPSSGPESPAGRSPAATPRAAFRCSTNIGDRHCQSFRVFGRGQSARTRTEAPDINDRGVPRFPNRRRNYQNGFRLQGEAIKGKNTRWASLISAKLLYSGHFR